MLEKEKNIAKRMYKERKQYSITINRKWKKRRLEKEVSKIMEKDES